MKIPEELLVDELGKLGKETLRTWASGIEGRLSMKLEARGREWCNVKKKLPMAFHLRASRGEGTTLAESSAELHSVIFFL